MPDRRADLRVLLDRVANLLVENTPVGHDDDGVEGHEPFMLKTDQLMGQPGDRVALAAAGGVLDEVAFSRTVFRSIGEQMPHHIWTRSTQYSRS